MNESMGRHPSKRVELRESQSDRRVLDIQALLDQLAPSGEQTLAERDSAAVEHEEVFIRRFGFDWPRRYREGLIRLKCERDITDREIRLLYRAGCLRREAGSVRFQVSRWTGASGWVLIACLTPAIVLFSLGVATHAPTTISQGLSAAGVAGGLMLLVWIGYAIYIKPWRIHLRTMHTSDEVLANKAQH